MAWQRLADADNAIDHVAGDGGTVWLSYVHRTFDLQRKADLGGATADDHVGAFGVLAFVGTLTLAARALVRQVRSQRTAVTIARVLSLTRDEAALARSVDQGLSLAVALRRRQRRLSFCRWRSRSVRSMLLERSTGSTLIVVLDLGLSAAGAGTAWR